MGNEAYLALDEMKGQFDIVTPSTSILAEPPVAVVDKNVDRHKTRAIAEAYLNFLYSPLAQDLIGKNLLPSAQRRGPGQVRGQVPRHQDGHHPRLRRLDQGPGDALRRRRAFDQIYHP